MLFHNCGERNLNLDLTASLPFTQSTYFSRHSGLYKDPCKIISKFVDFDEPTESDRYIGDLSISEDLDKEIEVDFFDNLKTPSEELKGFTPIDESNPLVSSLIAAVAAAYNSNSTATTPTASASSSAFFSNSEAIRTTNSLLVPSSSSLPSSLSSTPSVTPSPSPLPSQATSSISVISDTEMEEDHKSLHGSHHLSNLQVKQPLNTDSLMTPIIDPNGASSTAVPHFPSFDVNADNVFGQYLQELTQSVSCENDNNQQLQAQDIKPFSLVPSSVMYSDRQQQMHQQNSLDQSLSAPSLQLLHQTQQQQQQPSTTESNLDRSSSQLYSLGSSTSNQHAFDYPTTIPEISGYTNRSTTMCGVNQTPSSNIPTLGMIGTSLSLTTSSSSSSMSYAELKPRSYSFSHSQPSTSLSADNLVPTVVEDHPYTSRNNTSSPYDVHQPSFSPPSSCPSTSSLASTSDHREASRDLFSLINDVDYPTLINRKRHPNKSSHHDNSSSSRRGRLTKKEKLDKMISEEKRLENENTMLKDQLKVMEHQFKVLQTKITDILIDAAKRKS